MPSHEMNLLRATMHPVNFWTPWRLSGSFILVIAGTFSGLESMPRWETIYLSNFSEGTPKVHFLGFSFILNFLRLSKVSARSRDKSLIFLSFYDHIVNVRFSIPPNLGL
jgi:hypothetical protein